ncbi:unnamed protein product [Bathycoccus prasinos]
MKSLVVSDAHAVATPVANDNIDEGVDPSWKGINESDWNGINDDDLNAIDLEGVDTPISPSATLQYEKLLLAQLGDNVMIPVNDVNELNCGPITPHEMKYSIDKIRSARIIKDPFPHVFIENIYAQRVYSCMLKNMPQEDNDRVLVSSRTKGLPDWKFWVSYTKVLGGSQVAQAWVGYSLDLNRDLAGYYIAPHTDSVNKLVTTLYYLPIDATNSAVGTTMYKSLNTRPGASATKFKAMKQARFLPNSVLAFAPCKSSWHGIEERKINQGIVRDTIQAFVRVSGGNRAKSRGRLPQGTRSSRGVHPIIKKRYTEEEGLLLRKVLGLARWKSKTRIRMSNMEGWSTEKDTKNQEKLKDDLISSMRIRNAKFWYGFNFPSCAEGLVIQQLSGGGSWKWVSRFSRLDAFPPSEQLTYADLLSGRNYHYFGMKRLLFETARRSNTIIFANRKVKQNKKISWQQRIIPFEADLTGNWLQVRDTVLDEANKLAKSRASHIFLISLGPISNILIASMWKVNKNNTYIDVGAALNEFHGFGSQGRAYLRNPACQALGPTCTAMRYRLNLNVTSSMDISVRSVNSIDKLRCCTPVLNGCSLKLERWLVNTTPSLDESSIIVQKSKPLGRGGFCVVFKGHMLRSSTKKTYSP